MERNMFSERSYRTFYDTTWLDPRDIEVDPDVAALLIIIQAPSDLTGHSDGAANIFTLDWLTAMGPV